MIKDKKICFIGAGSMAEAIISGLIHRQLIPETNISVTNRQDDNRLQQLSVRYGVFSERIKHADYIRQADILVLAVKPYAISEAISAIHTYTNEQQLVVSVLAGTPIQTIANLFEYDAQIIRTMPNTSAVVGESATAICAAKNVNQEQVQIVREMFKSIGIVLEVEESQMDAITAVSGSGPAYVYYFIEAIEDGAREVGLSDEQGKQLALQTLAGASKMLLETKEKAQQLRKNVTSPHGTTAYGIQTLESYSFKQAVIDCIVAARDRAKELGKKTNK